MKLSAAVGLAASAALLTAVVPARAQPKPAPTTGPTVTGQSTTSTIETPAPPAGPRPLFRAGNVTVGIWAPIQAPYNANNNRNLAANPIWQTDMARPSGY
jgi:hypothetical protein